MVFNQVNYRFAGDHSYIEAVDFASFFQQIAEVVGHRSYEVHGHFFVVLIFPDVDVDEFAEPVVDKVSRTIILLWMAISASPSRLPMYSYVSMVGVYGELRCKSMPR